MLRHRGPDLRRLQRIAVGFRKRQLLGQDVVQRCGFELVQREPLAGSLGAGHEPVALGGINGDELLFVAFLRDLGSAFLFCKVGCGLGFREHRVGLCAREALIEHSNVELGLHLLLDMQQLGRVALATALQQVALEVDRIPVELVERFLLRRLVLLGPAFELVLHRRKLSFDAVDAGLVLGLDERIALAIEGRLFGFDCDLKRSLFADVVVLDRQRAALVERVHDFDIAAQVVFFALEFVRGQVGAFVVA